MSNAHFLKGEQKYKQSNYEEAVAHFSAAIEQQPGNAEIFYQRGLSYFHMKKKSLALLDFNEALSLEPKNPFRYASRAYIKDSIGDLTGAIQDYEEALKLDPEDAVAHNNLGLLQEKLGYKQKAEKHFGKADELAQREDFLTFKSANQAADQEQQNQEITEDIAAKESVLGIMKRALTDKNTFREFLTFVSNGFK